jgi:hypothetical protein
MKKMPNKGECYERYPIQLNSDTIVMLHLFHRKNHIEDICWSSECTMSMNKDLESHTKAAEQFINQLEDHWTPLFMMELRDRINERLKRDDKKYGTKFSREYIEEGKAGPDKVPPDKPVTSKQGP